MPDNRREPTSAAPRANARGDVTPLARPDHRFLINDMVVAPDKCNFACEYCIFTEAPSWARTNLPVSTVYEE